MEVAVVQYRPEPGQVQGNVERSLDFIRTVGRAADLLVLPEACVTGYYFRDRSHLAAHAEAVPSGPTIRRWVAAAREVNTCVVAGFIEQAGHRLFNSAVVISPEGVVGLYRKMHLHSVEWGMFDPGDLGFPVVDLPCGRVGVLICFDLRFVEASRALMLKGADILCVPTTWSNLYKPQPFDERGWCMADYMAQAIAYFNRYYVACADRIGGELSPEGPVQYLGASLIVDPFGQVLAGPAPPDREAVLRAEVQVGKSRDKSLGRGDLVGHRRPEWYGPLAEIPERPAGAL